MMNRRNGYNRLATVDHLATIDRPVNVGPANVGRPVAIDHLANVDQTGNRRHKRNYHNHSLKPRQFQNQPLLVLVLNHIRNQTQEQRRHIHNQMQEQRRHIRNQMQQVLNRSRNRTQEQQRHNHNQMQLELNRSRNRTQDQQRHRVTLVGQSSHRLFGHRNLELPQRCSHNQLQVLELAREHIRNRWVLLRQRHNRNCVPLVGQSSHLVDIRTLELLLHRRNRKKEFRQQERALRKRLHSHNRLVLDQPFFVAALNRHRHCRHNRSQPQVLSRSRRRVVVTTIHVLAGDIHRHCPRQLRSRKILRPVPRLDIRSRHIAAIGQLGLLRLLRCTSLQNYRVAL